MRTMVGMSFAALLLAAGGPTAPADSIKAAIEDGELELNLRYRFEWVEQDGFDDTANANTIRLRVGWTTARWHGLYAHAALDGNFAPGTDRYSSTQNGLGQYPVIADPDDQQLNQAYLGYGYDNDAIALNASIGRQRINLDNQRFVGSVAFRQLEQTFDTFRFNIEPVKGLWIDYMFADRVYRVFGNHNPSVDLAEQDIEAHFFNVGWDVDPVKVVGYWYATEFESLAASSQQNVGVRVTGNPRMSGSWTLPFQAEYAHQTDYRNSPTEFDTDYRFAEVGIATKPFTVKVGYELLGSDGGTRALQTPLATLHKFNGWADVFLLTPDAGLQDLYLWVQGQVAKVHLAAVVHDFGADDGPADYGTEWGVRVWRRFDIYDVELKYADFQTDVPDPLGLPFQRDTRKFWLTLGLAL